MMISHFKQSIQRHLINAPGFRSKRKFVIIESDDWGAIRMPSIDSYNYLLGKGIINKDDPFAKYDTIATTADLEHLFNTLKTLKDYKGNHPVITANCVVANPDFDLIKKNDYRTYHYEPITETFKRYTDCEGSLELWIQGMKDNLFFPQYHGREHVNVSLWLQQLQNATPSYIEAFACGTYAVDHRVAAALAFQNEEQQANANSSVVDGYQLFEKLFGYRSKTFIAPNYTWDKSIEKTLYGLDIQFLQGSKKQNVPYIGKNALNHKYHYTGQKNNFGQYYLVRNCLFEPALSSGADYVGACLRHIKNAFFWNKPAIIGSHRLNYVGSLDGKNRNENLMKLKSLLKSILTIWPDVEFIHSAALGQLLLDREKE